tara:strand:- start:1352 stop:1729 length:378 start_codon:yes stop_codon:yes gene_type:complete
MTVRLTDQNFIMMALKTYENPACESMEEFQEDLHRIKYIKRLFSKYHKSGELRERLILNHIIVLNNLFGTEFCVRMLFFNVIQEHHSYLKAFLDYLKYLPTDIPELNLSYVNMDSKIAKSLEKLK